MQFRFFCSFCLLFFSGFIVRSQSFDAAFANHLVQNKLTMEAAAYLTQALADSSNKQQKDTINFLLGNIYFDRQQHTEASIYYSSVSGSFANKFISDLKHSISLISLEKKEEASYLLGRITTSDTLEMQILLIFKAALALSDNEYRQYLSYDSLIAFNSFIYDDVRAQLKHQYTQKISAKEKSPFLAGLFSAVIPGAGKLYAGKPYDALASFLQTGVLGAIALENLLKAGPASARFVVLGGLFGLFYIGNIWGSVVAVKVEQKQLAKQFNDEIIRNMYITIRNYKG